jgi:hypothetical protein
VRELAVIFVEHGDHHRLDLSIQWQVVGEITCREIRHEMFDRHE